MQSRLLEGKVALVTGAGSPIGLGRNMAEALVQAGARVALMDINRDWLEESANDLREIGGDDRVLTIDRDVSAPEDAEEAVGSTIAGLGGLHILVNNAGTNAHKWGAPGSELLGHYSRNLGQGNVDQPERTVFHGQGRGITPEGAGLGPDHRRDHQHGHDDPPIGHTIWTVQGGPRGTDRRHGRGVGGQRGYRQRAGARRQDQHQPVAGRPQRRPFRNHPNPRLCGNRWSGYAPTRPEISMAGASSARTGTQACHWTNGWKGAAHRRPGRSWAGIIPRPAAGAPGGSRRFRRFRGTSRREGD